MSKLQFAAATLPVKIDSMLQRKFDVKLGQSVSGQRVLVYYVSITTLAMKAGEIINMLGKAWQ